ncbi:phage tail fiber protein [Pseudomonas rustica]|uniref:phage tail fiber protein n=1 Tax=Pseudomonas rustica TaxID=2827099 RepID=UPI001FE68374|nr:hypothetical protein [Pseudomonas rustica]
MPWLRGGTVSVTNGTTTVIGTNTDFAATSRIGDAFVGPDGVNYEIGNVASASVISIIPAYKGATASGVAYAIMPVQGYPQALADSFNNISLKWGAKLESLGATGNYEVLPVNKGGTGATDPAGARAGIGAAKSGANSDITSMIGLTTALSVAQGGTGGNSQATARAGLGLGSAATATLGNNAGNAMPVGAFGLGGEALAFANIDALTTTEFKSIVNPAGTQPGFPYGTSLTISYNAQTFSQFAMSILGTELAYRYYNSTTVGFSPWVKLYHTGNTTRGSGGALSAASPIIRIANVTDSHRRDLQEQTFEPAGAWGVANNEARGVNVERLGVGEYRITGSLGLAIEGWRTQDPCSPDGGGTLGITESEQDTDGTVTIRLFKQRWTLSDDGEMLPGRGAPLDVPLNSWIDVRLEMPQPDYQPPPNDPVNE